MLESLYNWLPSNDGRLMVMLGNVLGIMVPYFKPHVWGWLRKCNFMIYCCLQITWALQYMLFFLACIFVELFLNKEYTNSDDF